MSRVNLRRAFPVADMLAVHRLDREIRPVGVKGPVHFLRSNHHAAPTIPTLTPSRANIGARGRVGSSTNRTSTTPAGTLADRARSRGSLGIGRLLSLASSYSLLARKVM
jgi:hypothetical protein